MNNKGEDGTVREVDKVAVCAALSLERKLPPRVTKKNLRKHTSEIADKLLQKFSPKLLKQFTERYRENKNILGMAEVVNLVGSSVGVKAN